MRFRLLWLAAAVPLCCALPAFAQHRVTAQLDSPQQVMEGWGTSIVPVSGDHRSQAFRTAYRDLGLNIMRIQMSKEVLVQSANDFATPVELTDDLATNLDLMGANDPFNPSGSIGFQAMDEFGETAEWLANNALEPDRVKISASPWSPPHWMKGPTGATQNFVGVTSNHPTPFLSNMVVPWRVNNPIPTGSSVGGRLKTEDPWTIDQYGKYMASWVAGWNQRYPDAPLDIISLQNESTFENPFDSMTFIVDENGNQDFSQYAKGLKAVKDAWEQFGLDTKVMGPHHANFQSSPSSPWSMWRQLMMIREVKSHADPELVDFLDFYNANFYNSTSEGNIKNIAAFWEGADAVPGTWNQDFLFATGQLARDGVEGDGKGIWFSETGDGGGSAWSSNIETAAKIHSALVHGQASAYVYWQFADGGSSLSQHVLLAEDQLEDPLQSKKYAAFKQYSRYIRPGAVRLDAGFDTANGAPAVGGNSEFDIEDSLNVASFLHEEDARLTFVLLNMKDSLEQVTLAIPEQLEVPTMQLFRTSETESFADLGMFEFVNGELLYNAPALSVSTFTGLVISDPTDPDDLNGDGDVGSEDIDFLFANLGSGDPALDLSGPGNDGQPDGSVDSNDVSFFVEETLNTFFGDANLDLAVDVTDLGRLGLNFGETDAAWADGDFTGDSVVDVTDLGRLGLNFGSSSQGAAGSAAVPEPTALALLSLGGLAMLCRRR